MTRHCVCVVIDHVRDKAYRMVVVSKWANRKIGRDIRIPLLKDRGVRTWNRTHEPNNLYQMYRISQKTAERVWKAPWSSIEGVRFWSVIVAKGLESEFRTITRKRDNAQTRYNTAQLIRICSLQTYHSINKPTIKSQSNESAMVKQYGNILRVERRMNSTERGVDRDLLFFDRGIWQRHRKVLYFIQ